MCRLPLFVFAVGYASTRDLYRTIATVLGHNPCIKNGYKGQHG